MVSEELFQFSVLYESEGFPVEQIFALVSANCLNNALVRLRKDDPVWCQPNVVHHELHPDFEADFKNGRYSDFDGLEIWCLKDIEPCQ